MKITSLFLATILAAVLCINETLSAATYSGGSGTATDPYQISTVPDWQTFTATSTDWTKHFILTANIDFGGMVITPVAPTSPGFTGVFDGQGFVVRNAVIYSNFSTGIFGHCGGQIRNLGAEQMSMTGDQYTGVLVSYNENSGSITSCYTTGSVIGNISAGGLVGKNLGSITDCHSTASVIGVSDLGGLVGTNSGPLTACYSTGVVAPYQGGTAGGTSIGGLAGSNSGLITACYSTASVSGQSIIGGLVGLHSSGAGTITACYATGSVSGISYVGGLAGKGEGKINFCYSSGLVSGMAPVGGLIGASGTAGPTTNFCFWDVQTSRQATSGGGTGLPTAGMYNPESYLHSFWDFKGEIANGTIDYWTMPANGGYPILAWQVDDSSAPVNDEMSGALAIAAGSSLPGSSTGAMGLDITANGYNDWADVWYYFDCGQSGNFTITVQGATFDTTLAVFDGVQREIIFNDDFFGGKSAVILKAKSGKRYYIRVSGDDGSTGNFTISVQQGAVQAIQGDLNYDGKVNLVDFSAMAQNWMMGE